MANDELITKYTLKDDYSSGLAKISKNTAAFAAQAKKAQQATGGSSGSGGGTSLMGAFTALKGGITPVTAALTAVVAGVTAVIGAGAGLAAIAKESMAAFAPYDTLERTFTGIYGSASKAKQMMGFLNSEAQKSNFLYADLAQNAKLLALQGIKWGDYSDAIQGLAIRGGGSSESLGMATSTVTRIKGGDYGEAFENLRQFGYSRDVLTQMGLVFDKAGSYKGTMQQALDVIKKIGVENKGVVDAMNGGAEATLGNLGESFTLALADIGGSIFKELKPFIESVTAGIGDAINSGALKDMVDSIFSMFNPDPGSFSLNKIIASVIAGVETAVAFVKTVWDSIRAIYNFLAPIIKFVSGITPGGMIANALGSPSEDTYKASYERTMATMEAYQKKKAKGIEVKEPDSGKASPVVTPLQQIADNTKATAQHTKAQADMSRHIFGGGDLGRMGISPVDIGGLNRGGNDIKIRVVGGAGKALEELISAVAMQTVSQMRRRGI